jgi:virginiamycin B lyase
LRASQPISIAEGPDGNLWFTLQNSSKIARVTPAGVITQFRTPTLSFPSDITAGPDGNIWFTEGSTGKIGFATPQGRITEITFSLFDAGSGIITGPDDNIWFCDSTGNNIWRYELATETLTAFPVPVPGSFPQDIAVGGDGNLWFTGVAGGQIGRITPEGDITTFGQGLDSARSITGGPDGNVWFTFSFMPMIGRITPTGEVTLFPTPNNPEQITRGEGNTLLFTEFGASRIAQITTDGLVTESPAFTHFVEPTGITTGPARTIWFLDFNNNRVFKTDARIFGSATGL